MVYLSAVRDGTKQKLNEMAVLLKKSGFKLETKFRSKWVPSVVIMLTALLTLYNLPSFVTDEVLNVAEVIRYVAIYTAMCASLLISFKLPKLLESAVSVIFLLIGPWLTFETVKIIIGVPHYQTQYIYRLNLWFYIAIEAAVFVITQSPRIAASLGMAIGCLANLINELVLMMRGTPLVPTDLYAISTAMKVTTPQDWHFNIDMLTGTMLTVFFISFMMNFKFTYPFKKVLRPLAAVAGAVYLATVCIDIVNIDYKSFSTSTFDTESTNNLNGTALSFYINFRKMGFDPPQGYSSEAVTEYLDRYQDEPVENVDDLPNIIVIMNESFSDLSYLGRLRTDTRYLEYFNSLTRQYPHGRVLVSVLGGGTCNTEFEYLTGLSMLNMPNGCYAYMQHITGKVDSMASYLKSIGYDTVAMHPFYEVCWKRNSIYKFMGFDDFISGEDMAAGSASKYVSADRWEKGFGDNVEYIRTLISDSFFYDKIIERFEEKSEDKPLFIFGVTVQNHSTYEYDGDDFETDVHILSPEGEYPRAEQYLSLIKDSDEALEELITYFEGVDEKTMIVFFGDHQPNVESKLIDELAPYRNLFVNSYLTRFETPFVIWSNFEFDDAGKDLGILSANYLGLETLERAGVPLSKDYQFLRDVRQEATAMASWGYFGNYGDWFEREDVYESEKLNIYNFYTYWKLTKK